MSTDLTVATEFLNPISGELVPVTDTNGIAEAVRDIRALQQTLRDAVADATTILVEESKRQGKKTLHLADTTVEIRGGQETIYDTETLRTSLEFLGLPQERIAELIRTEITYKVDGRVAKQLAAANDDYANALEASKSVVEKPYYAKVREAEPF